VLALEMLILMLENPSDDSVEMAVDFCKDVGAFLQEVAPAGLHSVFERFRTILHEGAIDKRVQYIIEGLFAIRKVGVGWGGVCGWGEGGGEGVGCTLGVFVGERLDTRRRREQFCTLPATPPPPPFPCLLCICWL
jgi:hypothetical protein